METGARRWVLVATLTASWMTQLCAAGTAPVIKGADLELLDEVRHIAEAVERVRGEAFERPPVAVRVPDTMREVAAEIRAYSVLTRARIEARGRAWADIGLGSTDTPRSVLLTLASDLAGIGFDPDSNRLLVAPDRLKSGQFAPREEFADDPDSTLLLMTGVRPDEPLTAHLLMHVRQRERRAGAAPEQTTDRLLADAAWAEGEANLVAIRRLFGGMGLADEILAGDLDPGSVLDGSLVPPGLDRMSGVERGLIDFVYRDGFFGAVDRFRRGGWTALDAAMRERRTTRDLLHPARAVAPAVEFGEPVAPREGLRLIDRDTLGEQVVIVLVSTLTGKDNLGLIAGDGWRGDRLERWEGEAVDRGTTVWRSAWKDEQAAKDFEYAVGRTLEARFPRQSAVPAGEGAERRWLAGGRRFSVSRSADRVLLRIDPGD